MAGASQEVVNRVCEKIEKDLQEGMTTEELFKKAFQYLRTEDLHTAARYSLKRGIAALGPAGFLFEQYLEHILQAYGYETKRDVILQGVCVSHEIDIVARKERKHFLVEAKYHNRGGIKTDVTVAMYADARLLDVTPVQEKKEAEWKEEHGMWLITNTKFTTTAIEYGKCKGMKMTGWSYPYEESLERLIIKERLYPITVLPSVLNGHLQLFAKGNIMLVRDVAAFTPDALSHALGIKKQHAERIVGEALVFTAQK